MSNTYIERLNAWPEIKNDDVESLEELSLFLVECFHYLETMSVRNQLQSPQEIMNVVLKLPYRMRDRWRRKSHELQTNYGGVYFRNLVDFVSSQLAVLKQPIFGNINNKNDKPKSCAIGKDKKMLAAISENRDESSNDDSVFKFCDYCKMGNHFLASCKFFKGRTSNEKSQFIKKSSICFGCLRKGHVSKYCEHRSTCGICARKHPTILHDNERIPNDDPNGNNEVQPNHEHSPPVSEETSVRAVRTLDQLKKKVIHPYLPVRVKIPNKAGSEIVVNCALDSGSSDCWMSDSLLSKLKLDASPITLNINTMDRKNCKVRTKVVYNLELAGYKDNAMIKLPVVYTESADSWPFSKDDLFTIGDLRNYPHLQNVQFDLVNSDIDLLIGSNVPSFMKPLRVIDGEQSDPFATLHPFGWALNSPVARNAFKRQSHCNRVSVGEGPAIDKEIELMFSQDFYDDSLDKSLSKNDELFMSKLELSIRKLPNGHYEVGLPLKDDHRFPSNRDQVYRQFINTVKRLEKDRTLFNDYNNFIYLP